MFSVIFEVHPKPEKFGLYLELAKALRPILEGIDGFIDNERFESVHRCGWVLSHSTWREEKSVVRWRTVGKHHDRGAARSLGGVLQHDDLPAATSGVDQQLHPLPARPQYESLRADQGG